MGQQPPSYVYEIARSEDYTLGDRTRSGIRHDLMDEAEEFSDTEMWRAIGFALVKAFKKDDLTPQVSDHFVRACPDEIFREFARQGPYLQFRNWRKRADKF